MRRGTAIVALAFATALFGACTGELIPTEPGGGGITPGVDAGGGGGGGGGINQAAKAYYDANVANLMQINRPLGSCALCHQDAAVAGPDFMGAGRADEYGALLTGTRIVNPGIPASSLLVTRGAHSGDAFEAAEIQIVNAWISMLAN